MAVPPPPKGLIAPPREPRAQLGAVPPPPPTGFSGICNATAKGKAPPPPPEGFSGVFKAEAVPKVAKAAAVPVEPKAAKAEKSDALVKHVYFDFDQTISKVHVFKQLAGWEPGVAGQHALSERGQIHRLKLLNDLSQYQYQPNGHVMPCPAGAKGAASWTAGALGGPFVSFCQMFWESHLLVNTCEHMWTHLAHLALWVCHGSPRPNQMIRTW